MTAASTATKPKVRRRRPVVLANWSGALIASARTAALHLHEGRPRIAWEGSGYLERKVTVRGATCVECGCRIQPGELALHGETGDVGRTPRPRFLHLERCTGIARRQAPSVRVPAGVPESPASLAQIGRFRPDALTPEEVRAVCELALGVRRGEVA